MASKSMLLVIISVVVAIVAAPAAMAEKIAVGDEHGWTLDFDYTTWSAGKQFHVGDTIVFNYKKGVHNVVKVNQTQYVNCDVSNTVELLITGNDEITLAMPGKKWYVCGVGEHCSKRKMKFSIDVLPYASAPAPSPSAESAAIDITPSRFLSLFISATILAFYFAAMA